MIEYNRQCIKFYKDLTTEPEITLIYNQFAKDIKMYAEQYFKNKIYVIF